jgi:MoxR-like ATPase
LLTVNCHSGTETADFLGSLRPARLRTFFSTRLQEESAAFVAAYGSMITNSLAACSVDEPSLHSTQDKKEEKAAVDSASAMLNQIRGLFASLPSPMQDAESVPAKHLQRIEEYYKRSSAVFEWVDGPLVTALRQGSFFLLDECSLAEDAVLERLNSVLEPGRTLTLAEKGSAGDGVAGDALITAAKGFRFFATMNPGGDFGKRELSPALRNRFTEVWVPPVSDAADLLQIIRDKAVSCSLAPRNRPSGELVQTALAIEASSSESAAACGQATVVLKPWRRVLVDEFSPRLVDFVLWFDAHASSGRLVPSPLPRTARPESMVDDCLQHSNQTAPEGRVSSSPAVEPPRARVLLITLRDLHQWLAFMAEIMSRRGSDGPSQSCCVSLWQAYCHAACLVLLDGLGLGTGLAAPAVEAIRAAAITFILNQAPDKERSGMQAVFEADVSEASLQLLEEQESEEFGMAPFYIPRGSSTAFQLSAYTFDAPTTRTNLRRVLRALQVRLIARSPIPIFVPCSPGLRTLLYTSPTLSPPPRAYTSPLPPPVTPPASRACSIGR